MGLNTVILVLLLSSIVILALAMMVLLRGPWFWGWLKGTLGLAGMVLAAYLVFLCLGLMGYGALEENAVVATVSFEKQDESHHVAKITPASKQALLFTLEGDLWQLNLRALQWQGPLTLFSPKQGYQLSQLTSRYLSLEKSRLREPESHDLTPVSLWLDAWEKGGKLAALATNEKHYKTPFLPIADGALYQVMWQDGRLVGQPLNGVAEEAMLN